MLLNNDTYNRLGSYTNFGDNNATRIIEAWASVLQLDPYVVQDLVHFPVNNPIYYLNRNVQTFPADYARAFERA